MTGATGVTSETAPAPESSSPLDAIGSIKVKLGVLVAASVVVAALIGAAGARNESIGRTGQRGSTASSDCNACSDCNAWRTSRVSFTTSPSWSMIMRSAWWATQGSCVTIITVMPLS